MTDFLFDTRIVPITVKDTTREKKEFYLSYSSDEPSLSITKKSRCLVKITSGGFYEITAENKWN